MGKKEADNPQMHWCTMQYRLDMHTHVHDYLLHSCILYTACLLLGVLLLLLLLLPLLLLLGGGGAI